MPRNVIDDAKRVLSPLSRGGWLVHSARTGCATAAALAVAGWFSLPEAYWAAITTVIIMQSTLGATWAISKQRLAGTALGAAAGALLASYFKPGIVVYGLAMFFLGLVCGILRLERSAYRFAGITFTIMLLIARAQPPWVVGIHRFVEVSLGIGVGLAFTAVWPLRDSESGKT